MIALDLKPEIQEAIAILGWNILPTFKKPLVMGVKKIPLKLLKALLSDINITMYVKGDKPKTKEGYILAPVPDKYYINKEESSDLTSDVIDLDTLATMLKDHWLDQVCTSNIPMANKIKAVSKLCKIKVREKTPYKIQFLESVWDFRNLTVTIKGSRVMRVLKMHFIGDKIIYGDKAMLLAVLSLSRSCNSPEELNYKLNRLTNLFRIEDNYGAKLTENDSLYQIREHNLGLLGVSDLSAFPFFVLENTTDKDSITLAVNACSSKGWSVTTDKYAMKTVVYGPGAEAMCIRKVNSFDGTLYTNIATLCDTSKVEKMLNRPSQFFGSPFAGSHPFSKKENLDSSALSLRLTVIDYSREGYEYDPK
jgi:hypothetical protein